MLRGPRRRARRPAGASPGARGVGAGEHSPRRRDRRPGEALRGRSPPVVRLHAPAPRQRGAGGLHARRPRRARRRRPPAHHVGTAGRVPLGLRRRHARRHRRAGDGGPPLRGRRRVHDHRPRRRDRRAGGRRAEGGDGDEPPAPPGRALRRGDRAGRVPLRALGGDLRRQGRLADDRVGLRRRGEGDGTAAGALEGPARLPPAGPLSGHRKGRGRRRGDPRSDHPRRLDRRLRGGGDERRRAGGRRVGHPEHGQPLRRDDLGELRRVPHGRGPLPGRTPSLSRRRRAAVPLPPDGLGSHTPRFRRRHPGPSGPARGEGGPLHLPAGPRRPEPRSHRRAVRLHPAGAPPGVRGFSARRKDRPRRGREARPRSGASCGGTASGRPSPRPGRLPVRPRGPRGVPCQWRDARAHVRAPRSGDGPFRSHPHEPRPEEPLPGPLLPGELRARPRRGPAGRADELRRMRSRAPRGRGGSAGAGHPAFRRRKPVGHGPLLGGHRPGDPERGDLPAHLAGLLRGARPRRGAGPPPGVTGAPRPDPTPARGRAPHRAREDGARRRPLPRRSGARGCRPLRLVRVGLHDPRRRRSRARCRREPLLPRLPDRPRRAARRRQAGGGTHLRRLDGTPRGRSRRAGARLHGAGRPARGGRHDEPGGGLGAPPLREAHAPRLLRCLPQEGRAHRERLLHTRVLHAVVARRRPRGAAGAVREPRRGLPNPGAPRRCGSTRRR